MFGSPWLDRARALVPVLRQRAADCEARRYLLPETVADLAAAGFLRMLKPARYGGVELPIETAMGVVATVGEGCASTAWCLALLVLHNLLVGLFPERAQEEVFGDGREPLVAAAFSPGATARPEVRDGVSGFRVTGHWRYASAVDHAAWVVGAARAERASPISDVRLFLIPKSECRVEDTWVATGLRGTGSKGVVVEDCLVPAHRTLALFDVARGRAPGSSVNPAPLFRLPLIPPLAVLAAAPALGAARAAIAAFIERHRRRATAPLPTLPSQLGLAAAEVEAAAALLHQRTRELGHYQETGEAMSRDARARYRPEAALAVSMCIRAVDRLISASGLAGLAAGSPLERASRDLRALSAYALLRLEPATDLYGRVSLGLAAPSTLL